jgi:cytosine/adenosine deaminase-related metal-dependent hydrolase
MGSCAITNATWVINPGSGAPALENISIIINEGFIAEMGPADRLDTQGYQCIDGDGLILIPGLINTHDHFLQNLTRALPAGQNKGLHEWQRAHEQIWWQATPEALASATQIAAAERLLSGCTTTVDHNYFWPNGARVDDQISAMAEMGMRFHVARGSITQAGLLGAEDDAAVLADYERIINRYHDPKPGSQLQIVLAPRSPYAVTPTLMRESAALARRHKVRLHTHLAESQDEVDWARENLGQTPLLYVESLGWLADDVWFAHMVALSSTEIVRVHRSGCGVAHCPCSNMRLGNGIAPIKAMLAAGLAVSIGLDGGASNDSGHLLNEIRQALLLQRVNQGAAALSAEQALSLATVGGAKILGRNDIGALAPGMAADIAGYRLDALEMAGGAVHDPLAALVFCPPQQADLVIVNGQPRVQNGELLGHDLGVMIDRHNRLAKTMAAKASNAKV